MIFSYFSQKGQQEFSEQKEKNNFENMSASLTPSSWQDKSMKGTTAILNDNILSYGNDKDCAPFIRLCLELLMMQKRTDQKIFGYK